MNNQNPNFNLVTPAYHVDYTTEPTGKVQTKAAFLNKSVPGTLTELLINFFIYISTLVMLLQRVGAILSNISG